MSDSDFEIQLCCNLNHSFIIALIYINILYQTMYLIYARQLHAGYQNKHLNYEILMFSGKSSNQPGYRIQMTSCLSATPLVLFSPDLFKNGSKYLFQTKSISFTAKTLPQILEFIYLPRACIFFTSRYYMCDLLSTYLLLILKQKKLINCIHT